MKIDKVGIHFSSAGEMARFYGWLSLVVGLTAGFLFGVSL